MKSQRRRSGGIGVLLVAIVAIAGCAKSTTPSAAANETQSSTSSDRGISDFRGFLWGDTIEKVAGIESRRGQTVRDGYAFSTELAGFPVFLEYGYEAKRLASAKYSFPWSGEAKKCKPLMTAGSECSLESAAYALHVCSRISVLVGEKYKALDESDGYVVRPLPSVAELDRRLAMADTGVDHSTRQWASERVTAAQFLTRGRSRGEGWRCTFLYRPTPEIAGRLHAQAEAQLREAAKTDL
jgi:hypothetical protein